MKSSKKFPYELQVRLVRRKGARRKGNNQSGAGIFDILKKGVNFLTSEKAQKILKYAQKDVDYANKGQKFLSKYNVPNNQKGGYNTRRKRKRKTRRNRKQAGAGIFKLLYNVLKEI